MHHVSILQKWNGTIKSYFKVRKGVEGLFLSLEMSIKMEIMMEL